MSEHKAKEARAERCRYETEKARENYAESLAVLVALLNGYNSIPERFNKAEVIIEEARKRAEAKYPLEE